MKFGHALRLVVAGLRDLFAMVLGRAPYCIQAVGARGDLAVLATPDAVAGFAAITPPNSTWRNAVAARIALSIGAYRPGAAAAKIRCPTLYIICEHDHITPARFAQDAARRAPRGEIKSYACGHFDVYAGPLWEEVVGLQTDFLIRHLKPHGEGTDSRRVG